MEGCLFKSIEIRRYLSAVLILAGKILFCN